MQQAYMVPTCQEVVLVAVRLVVQQIHDKSKWWSLGLDGDCRRRLWRRRKCRDIVLLCPPHADTLRLHRATQQQQQQQQPLLSRITGTASPIRSRTVTLIASPYNNNSNSDAE